MVVKKKFFINSLKRVYKKIIVSKKISMIILETFQGWGAIFYPKIYVKEIEKFCKKTIYYYVLMKCSLVLQEQVKNSVIIIMM